MVPLSTTEKEIQMRSKGKNETEEKYFTFLDELRESGVTNMYGATPYLEDEFQLDKKEAKSVLIAWMKSFNN